MLVFLNFGLSKTPLLSSSACITDLPITMANSVAMLLLLLVSVVVADETVVVDEVEDEVDFNLMITYY